MIQGECGWAPGGKDCSFRNREPWTLRLCLFLLSLLSLRLSNVPMVPFGLELMIAIATVELTRNLCLLWRPRQVLGSFTKIAKAPYGLAPCIRASNAIATAR